MRKLLPLFLPILLIGASCNSKKDSAPAQAAAVDDAIIGRWDLTVEKEGRKVPSWLEVKLSGRKTLVGYFVADGGSARPISKVTYQGGKVNFSIPPQWEDSDKDMVFNGELKDGRLSGTILSSLGKTEPFTGDKAPSLVRDKAPEWGAPINLLNGKDLKGWHPEKGKNQWVFENGVLRSDKPGTNLVTDSAFNDFKLHIEFRYPKGSNSGVYLRGRYEVQVQDDRGLPPSNVHFAGVYGFLTPNQMTALEPGEWQSFDITLVGRTVTVVANGKNVIVEQIIPGITGGALDSREGEPGPIMLQGDHGPVEYRNIVLTPAR